MKFAFASILALAASGGLLADNLPGPRGLPHPVIIELHAVAYGACPPPQEPTGPGHCAIIMDPDLKQKTASTPPYFPPTQPGGDDPLLSRIPPDPVPLPHCGGWGEPECSKFAPKQLALLPEWDFFITWFQSDTEPLVVNYGTGACATWQDRDNGGCFD